MENPQGLWRVHRKKLWSPQVLWMWTACRCLLLQLPAAGLPHNSGGLGPAGGKEGRWEEGAA